MAAIKPESDLALLLHRHSLGINHFPLVAGNGNTSNTQETPPRSPLPAAIHHMPCTPAFWQTCGSGHTQLIPPCLIIQWKCPDWETGHFPGSFPFPAPRTVLRGCCTAPSRTQWRGGLRPCTPRSETAPPWVTCRIPRNLGSLLPPLSPPPCMLPRALWSSPVLGCTSPYRVAGGGVSFFLNRKPSLRQSPPPKLGGAPGRQQRAGGGGVQEAISQPVFMCSKTTRVQ